jgi:hypothetical protein
MKYMELPYSRVSHQIRRKVRNHTVDTECGIVKFQFDVTMMEQPRHRICSVCIKRKKEDQLFWRNETRRERRALLKRCKEVNHA